MERLFLTRFEIEGICPENAIERLKRGGIELFEIKKTEKTRIRVCVERKNRKKVFTILQNSCYNIFKVEDYGLSRFFSRVLSRAGMLVGAVAFVLLALLSNLFILRIDVVGSGQYYQREILALLNENGVGIFKRYSNQNTNLITAQILSLDRVSFCAIKKSGSILTVEVQVNDGAPMRQSGNLYSPVKGRVTSLVVVRGTAWVAVGDEVEKGQLLVGVWTPSVEEDTPPTSVEGRYEMREQENTGEEKQDQTREIVMASVTLLSQYQETVKTGEEQSGMDNALLFVQSVGGEVVQTSVAPQADGKTQLLCVEYQVTASINL